MSLSAYISEIAIPLDPLREAFGTDATPTGARLSDDGQFILVPLRRFTGAPPTPPARLVGVGTDIAAATTIVRPWDQPRRQRLAGTGGRLNELLRQLQTYLLAEEPGVRFVQTATSLTIVLAGGRRAGVAPQPTLGLRLRVRRGGMQPLVTRVTSPADFAGALAWLRSLPPPRGTGQAGRDQDEE